MILYGNDTRDKILIGVNKLNDALRVTLGPNGRYVAIKRPYNSPLITNDGATIAKMLKLEDEGEQTGLEALRDASMTVETEAGDGTTTTAVIAAKLINDACQFVSKSILANPIQIRREIESQVPVVIEELSKLKSDKVNLYDVALISSKDEAIAKLVSELLDGNLEMEVILDDSDTSETYYEKDNGFRIKSGSVSQRFLNDNKGEYTNPKILIVKGHLDDVNQIREIAAHCVSENHPLLIIADNFDISVVQQVISSQEVGLRCVLVKSPFFGESRNDTLSDIEALTGAKITEEPKLEDLGTIKTVKFDMNDTVFIGGDATDHIKAIEQTKLTTEYEKERLKHRISKLKGGVATIFVGGKTDVEQKQNKPRIEDAVRAVKSAKDGVVAGGGVALLKAAEKINVSTVGGKMVRDAIREPFNQIARNCGLSPTEIESKLTDGYDFKEEKYVNAIEAGIVDPFNVTKSAFEAAVSVAKTVLIIEANYYEEKEDARA